MKLDGYDIFVGDKVYDLLLKQWVVVKDVRDTSFVGVVKNTTHTYFGEGIRNNTKVAYWHEPMVIVPPKSVGEWNAQVKAYTHIVNAITEVQQGGGA